MFNLHYSYTFNSNEEKMTAPENIVQEQPKNDKEYNFRALEAKLRAEQQARLEAERKAQEALEIAQKAHQYQNNEEDEEDSDPYIDKRKLQKTLNKYNQSTQSEIQKAMELAKEKAKQELKQELWLEQNHDFYDIMKHAEKFAEKAPQLAESILRMPEGFERQKLVYQNIKALGLDKPEAKQPTIQEKIDSNKKSPYYSPSGVGSAPYNAVGDFSLNGQKQAYQKLQELKNRLRI